jgi:hypothetical protein
LGCSKARLSKLTQDDLVALAEANRKGARGYGGVLAKMESARSRLRGARVEPASYNNLSAGAKQFVSSWNKYLASLASTLGLEIVALERAFPRVNELQTFFGMHCCLEINRRRAASTGSGCSTSTKRSAPGESSRRSKVWLRRRLTPTRSATL